MNIKKIVTIAFYIVSAIMYSQEENTVAKLKPFFGLKAGVNVHPQKDPDGDMHYSFGYQAGSTLNIPMSSKFSFQPELLIQFIASEYDFVSVYSNGTESGESKTKSFYLNVPLNFKYGISKKVNIELGPNVTYLLSGKQKVKRTANFDGITSIDEFNYNSNSSSKKLGFGVNLGTGYAINDQLYVGFRYTLFISEYQSADDTLSNSVFALSVGYNFN